MTESSHPLSACPNCDTEDVSWTFKKAVTGDTTITILECNECNKNITEVDGPKNEYAIYSNALKKEDREALRERYRYIVGDWSEHTPRLAWDWEDHSEAHPVHLHDVALDTDLIQRMYQDELTAEEANVLQHHRNRGE